MIQPKDKVRDELAFATEGFLMSDDNVLVNLEKKKVTLSMILKWYQVDFGGSDKNVVKFIIDHLPKVWTPHVGFTKKLLEKSKASKTRRAFTIKVFCRLFQVRLGHQQFLTLSSITSTYSVPNAVSSH